MKKIVLLLFVLIIYSTSFAQQRALASIEGKVYKLNSDTIITGAIVNAVWGTNEYQDTTDNSGYYELDNLYVPGGPDPNTVTYTVIASASGFVPETVEIEIKKGDELTLDFYLKEKLGGINGIVELNDEIGFGTLEDVLISLIDGTDTIEKTNPEPDQEGYYEFKEIISGVYKVSASLEKFQTVTKQAIIDSNEVDTVNFSLNLIPGKISGKVIIEPNDLVTDVIISLNDTEYTTKPDTTGIYEFTNVEPYTYTVKASLYGYSSEPLSYPDTLLAPSDTIENLDFSMHPGFAKIFGHITNDSVSIEGATIIADTASTTSDAEGYYEIDSLPIGPISITATATGYLDSTRNVPLMDGENQVDFILLHQPVIIVDDVPQGGFDFGSILVGDSSVSKTFSVQGEYLQDNLIVKSTEPFEISLDNLDYKYEITIPNEESIIVTIIYVRFKPEEANTYTDFITLTSTNAKTKKFRVKGVGDEVEQLNVEIIAEEEIICAGDSVLLTASVSGGVEGTYTYEWKEDTIILNKDSAFYAQPSETTKYTLIVTDGAGNTNKDQKIIQIYETVTIEDNPSDTSVCAGESVYFEVSLNIDKNVSYQWQVNDSDIEDNSIYSGVNTDELTVTTVDSLNQDIFQCKIITQCNDIFSESALLRVHRMPIDTIIAKGSPPVVLISPDSGSIYQWYKDGDSLIGENGQFYYPTGGFEPGSKYNVEIETEFGCFTTTKPYTVPDVMKSISVYPNPVSNTLFVDATFMQVESELTVVMTDLAGRQLIRERIYPNNRKTSFSLNRLKQGVYLIRVFDDTGKQFFSSKIIKN